MASHNGRNQYHATSTSHFSACSASIVRAHTVRELYGTCMAEFRTKAHSILLQISLSLPSSVPLTIDGTLSKHNYLLICLSVSSMDSTSVTQDFIAQPHQLHTRISYILCEPTFMLFKLRFRRKKRIWQRFASKGPTIIHPTSYITTSLQYHLSFS